ncbi:MAG TPA: TetR/AcrR family transcriptional regulator C-terminal domain-containing protein [Aggregatilinea sp.]|uniref:TetR/AcrR family transcriptional regulator n=1 Tax=Aggregatilinea sp. TaxID=2806333 RepID=UPI002C284825|nr:TetR/AcrR family transcriptional regulator C-terminal domain-containing protein [Aggregatilinea sp.]HML20342.1 TetR/AcrR family transcriptional regulator C-terminal domain-containing protein [Aggregatilinea sp.]
MAKKKIDRRVRYTKDVLKEALILLMADNHISKISVKKICEIADVNRSTFYAHYENQYDLLSHIERQTIQDIHTFVAKERSRQITLHTMLCLFLEYAAQNAKLFRVLLNERSDSAFSDEVIRLVKELALVETHLEFKTKPRVVEYIQLFSITGSLRVIEKWLEDGMIESIDEVADLLLLLFNHRVLKEETHYLRGLRDG